MLSNAVAPRAVSHLMSTQSMLRVEFQFPTSGIASTVFDCCTEATTIELNNALPLIDSRSLIFITVSASEELTIAAEDTELDIVHTQPASAGTHAHYVVALTPLDTIPLVVALATQMAVPHQVTATPANTTATVSVRDWEHLKQVADAIEHEHGSLELLGTTQVDRLSPPLGSEQIRHAMAGQLSASQLELLETAYEMGYFNVPQDATVAELAATLDISPSTLSERLRRVERTLCEVVFGPS